MSADRNVTSKPRHAWGHTRRPREAACSLEERTNWRFLEGPGERGQLQAPRGPRREGLAKGSQRKPQLSDLTYLASSSLSRFEETSKIASQYPGMLYYADDILINGSDITVAR